MIDGEKMRLLDLCDLVATQVDPRTHANDVYVGLEHLASGKFERIANGDASDVQSLKYAFQAHDVLYGKLRPYLDKAVLARDGGICTTELLVLRPKDGVDPRFLVSVLHTPSFVEHAVAGTTGAQHPRTSWNHISDFELPYFSPGERIKIANVVWQVYEAITAIDAAVEVSAELQHAAIRSLLIQGLSGEAQKETSLGSIPESWKVTTLGELCGQNSGRIQTGPFGSQLHAYEYEAEGTPVINPTHLAGNRIDHADVPRVSQKTSQRLERHRVSAGDILFGRRGEIGRHGLVSSAESGWLCGTGCFLVRVDHPDIDNAFLSYAFSTENALAWLTAHAAGTIMPNLNNIVLSQLPVAYPTIAEQGEIVAVLDAIDRKFNVHNRKRRVLNDLFKALLHKLMTREIRVADLDLSALEQKQAAEVAA